MVAPEALLLEIAENDPAIGRQIDSTGPLVTPYDALVHEDGWLIDAASTEATAPFDAPTAEADQRIVNALLVACDYAVRRGASSVSELRRILNRESPIGVVIGPGPATAADLVRSLGIATSSVSEPLASFRRRARAHAALAFDCDPVLSFQPRTLDWDMGDNSLSSFVVHNEGERDGVSITGEVSERWGVEVGLPNSTPIEALPEVERQIALIPSFLSGVTSLFDGQTLEVGWAAGEASDVEQIGESIRVWTTALFDLDIADVRIVFAPPRGRSPVLTEMRARARAFRSRRDSIIAGQIVNVPAANQGQTTTGE